MAKGNMLLGYSQGSVGDVTFYRSGGSQRARARNRNPSNPRSNMQQTQRALFANCVKFHKFAVAKFFKFAFENKKTNESDYNAFMRENLKRGVMISKTANNIETYIALGNWLLTRGSLPTIPNANTDDILAPVFDLGAPYTGTITDNTTIAEISTAMVASGRYQVGDIITIVNYRGEGLRIPNAYPNAVSDQLALEFNYWQFLVDPNNAKSFTSIFGDSPIFHLVKTTNDTLAIMYGLDTSTANTQWSKDYETATVIHSRNTANGLLVSTQELTCNPNYIEAITIATTDANYKSAVLTDWNATDRAILQGGNMTMADAADYGEYIIGNKYDATTREVSIGNETGCNVGDGYSLHVQTENELTAEQVMALFRKSIINTDGFDIDYNPVNVTTDLAPGVLHGYSSNDLLQITRLPASLQFKTQTGNIRIVTYTA